MRVYEELCICRSEFRVGEAPVLLCRAIPFASLAQMPPPVPEQISSTICLVTELLCSFRVPVLQNGFHFRSGNSIIGMLTKLVSTR